MQYHQEGENVDTINSIDISAVQPLLQPDHSQIKQIRQFLLILLCICLVFAVIYLIMSIIGWAVTDGYYRKDERFQISEAIVSILFYGFGLLVTQKYRQKGLRVYGWLSIILLIIAGIVIIGYHLIRAKTYFPYFKNVVWMLFSYINYIISVWFHIFAVTIVIIIFSFKLARLMDADGRFITGEV